MNESQKKTKLTSYQKSQLACLEPELKKCVKNADLQKAKFLVSEIQKLLRPTGHETRLMKAKNWLFETALESGNLNYAEIGLVGVVKKSSNKTRIYLEAVSMLAICYIRKDDMDKAREYIEKAVKHISNVKSETRRKQFHSRLIFRLEEEGILAGLSENAEYIDEYNSVKTIDEVDNEAVKLVRTKSEGEIFEQLGRSIPQKSINLLHDIRRDYQLRLPAPDIKLLPPPVALENKESLGRRANAALKRVIWKVICDPDNKIYKAWSDKLDFVYSKKWISAAIVAEMGSAGIFSYMIAASASALAIAFGAEVFCEIYSPDSMMIDIKDKK